VNRRGLLGALAGATAIALVPRTGEAREDEPVNVKRSRGRKGFEPGSILRAPDGVLEITVDGQCVRVPYWNAE
jgi:hypothetical protein